MEKSYGTFELTQGHVSLHVNWDRKNYEVTANLNGMILTEYCHMMFMCPRIYTEEEVRKLCIDLIPVFLEAHKVITSSSEILSKKKEEYKKIKTEADSITNDLNEKKHEYKQQLKNCTLTKKAYDEKIAAIKKEKSVLCSKRENFLRETAREISSAVTRCTSIVYNYLKNFFC